MSSLSVSEPAVLVQDLHVTYRAMLERGQTIKSALRRFGRPSHELRPVEALRGVSLRVEHGSFLGIVGPNGAGKSTLLRAIAGIVPPSQGRIEVNGHVSTLLSVGIGFNGELSGRENIRLGCLANGMRPSDIADIEDEIAEFSGIGEFIDYPIKTYSSGMHSRLAFSVSVSLQPDILLIDEALSAGDAAFRDQAWAKIHELMEKARAIVLVSHGLALVEELADTVVWIEDGAVRGAGDPGATIGAYTESVAASAAAIVTDEH